MGEKYIKRIRTNEGDKQIDYEALANLPVGSESVKIAEQDLVLAEGEDSCSVPVERVNHGDVLRVEVYVDGKMWSTDVTAEAIGIGNSFRWQDANLGDCPWFITFSTHANVMAFVSYTASKYKKSSVIIYNTAIKRFDENYIPSTIARVADVDKKIEDNRLAYEEDEEIGIGGKDADYGTEILLTIGDVVVGETLCYEIVYDGKMHQGLFILEDCTDEPIYFGNSSEFYYYWTSGMPNNMNIGAGNYNKLVYARLYRENIKQIEDKFIPDSIARIADLEELKLKNTVGGSLLSLPDSAEAPLQGMKIFGKTEQASTTGKNKLVYPYVSKGTKTVNGVTFTDNGDGSITCSGTCTDIAEGFYLSRSYPFEAGKKYCFTPKTNNVCMVCNYLDATGKNLWAENNITWQEGYSLKNLYLQVSTGDTVSGTFYPIIVEGSTYDGNWEPYTGGIPSPNPSYPQALESVGDDGSVEQFVKGGNLFGIDSSTIEPVNYVDSQGNKSTRNGRVLRLPAGSYKASCKRISTNSGYEKLYIYSCINDSSGRFVSSDYIYAGENVYSPTITIRDGEVLYIYDASTGTTVNASLMVFNDLEIQLNPGTVATPYEPYKTPQSLTIPTPNGLPGVPVSSGGNYTDENGQQYVSDYKDYERKVYVQRVGEWRYTGGDVEINTCVVYQSHDVIYWNVKVSGVKASTNPYRVLSNAFSAGKSAYINPNHIMVTQISNYLYMSLKASDFGFIYGDGRNSEYKPAITNWMQTTFSEENPLIVLYELETPIETPLSEEEIAAYKALHTNYPNTTIYNDEGAYTEVKYVADTKNYVDNKIANEVAKLTAAIITE